MNSNDQPGESIPTQWAKHVFRELERLNVKFETMQADIHGIRAVLAKIEDVQEWKKDLEKEISIKDISQVKTDVDKLKIFKAQAVTVWVVVQGVMAVVTALSLKFSH